MDDTAKLNKLKGHFCALVDKYKELTDSQVEERKYVKEKFAEYQEFYNIDVRELQDEIDNLKSKLVITELDLKREKSKSSLLMSIKESRHHSDKFRLGFVESNLKALLNFIEHNCGEKEKSEVLKLMSDVGSTYTQNLEIEDTNCMEVEDADEKEDKHKTSMEQLLSLNTEKDETIQKLENDIDSKRVEVEQANEKLEELQTSLEQLQSSSREKDELIEILQRQAVKLDPILADMDQLLELHKADEKTILKLEDDIGSKCIEVEQANEKLDKLQTSMEQLQSSISGKDETIGLLKGEVEQANGKLEKIRTRMEQMQSFIRGKDETIVLLNGEVEQANEKLEKLQSSMEQLQSSIGGKDETIVMLKGEVEQTHMKVDKLVTSMQHLESSNTRKDEIIGKLKADLAKFEEETTKSKKEPSKLSEKVEILRKSEGASLMPVLNSYSGPLTRSMARQKRSMEIPTTFHALEGVSIAPVMISCTTKPCTQIRKPMHSQVRRPVSKTESLGSQVFDIEKTEMKKSITRKRKPDEDNSILKPRTRKKQCSS